MVETLRRLILPFVGILFAASAAVMPPAQAHTGSDPHVPDAWYAGYDYITFDMYDGEPHEPEGGWYFASMVDTIDARTAGAHMPVLRMGTCEATQGPCVDVVEVCRADQGMIWWNRNNDGPVHGQLQLNYCSPADGVRDRSASCRSIMRMLGVHPHAGAGCTSDPWFLSANYPTDTVYDVVNSAYQNRNGRQLPDPNG